METATLKSVVRMKTRIAAYDAGFFDDRMGRLANNEMPSAMMLVGSTGVGRSTLAEKIRSNALHGVRCSASDLISRFKLRRVVQADCVVLEDPEVQGVRDRETMAQVVKGLLSGDELQIDVPYTNPMTRRFHGLLVFVGNEVPQWMTPDLQRRIPVVRVLGHWE